MLKAKTIALLGLLAFSLQSSAFLDEAALALEWESGPGGRSAALPVSTSGQAGFVRLTPAQTGIAFTNRVSRQRYTTNQIYLNGSGVAAGDVDGDGWCDLFFADWVAGVCFTGIQAIGNSRTSLRRPVWRVRIWMRPERCLRTSMVTAIWI